MPDKKPRKADSEGNGRPSPGIRETKSAGNRPHLSVMSPGRKRRFRWRRIKRCRPLSLAVDGIVAAMVGLKIKAVGASGNGTDVLEANAVKLELKESLTILEQ